MLQLAAGHGLGKKLFSTPVQPYVRLWFKAATRRRWLVAPEHHPRTRHTVPNPADEPAKHQYNKADWYQASQAVLLEIYERAPTPLCVSSDSV